MTAPLVIADEFTALGYRLAGARVLTPAPDAVQRTFERAREDAEVLFITAELAACVAPDVLQSALLASQPLIVLIRDANGRVPLPDLAHELHRALGVET